MVVTLLKHVKSKKKVKMIWGQDGNVSERSWKARVSTKTDSLIRAASVERLKYYKFRG